MSELLDETPTNQDGIPIVELEQGDVQYVCPYLECADIVQVDFRSKSAYTCPRCHKPIELHLDGSLYRNAARPRRQSTTKTLVEHCDSSRIPEWAHDLPVMPRDADDLAELWSSQVGQVYLLQNLVFFCQGEGRGVPRHQKVTKSIAGAHKMMDKSGGLNAKPPQENRVDRSQVESTSINYGIPDPF